MGKVACVGTVVAWMFLLLIPAASAVAKDTPDYLRIAVSPKVSICVQFQDNEMRLSATSDGLETATPITASSASPADQAGERFAQFPEVALPIPADALPANVTKVTASFRHIASNGQPFSRTSIRMTPGQSVIQTAVGGLRIHADYKDGHAWAYLQKIDVQTDPSVAAAAPVQMADPSQMTLSVDTKASPGKFGADVKVIAGNVPLCDVKRDGQSVEVSVRILDNADGKEVASEKRRLQTFGFG